MNISEKLLGMFPEAASAPSPREETIPANSQPSGWFLAAVSVLMGLASLIMGQIMPINDDDAFYLHTWWLYAQGYVPYRDFLDGLPGLWLLLAPAAWLPWTPSSWIALGRALVAISFGVSFWLVGRLVRAYRWEVLFLAALAFIVMIWGEVFLFRRVYFELLFLMLHVWILDFLPQSRWPGCYSALAGGAIGTACMISQRGFYYLPIQPAFLLWIFWGQWQKLASTLIGWLVGWLLATVPTLLYLAYHQLWADQWKWTVLFPATLPYIQPRPWEFLHNNWALVGWLSCVGIWFHAGLAHSTKKLLTVAWAGTFAANLLNQFPIHYAYVSMHLMSVILITSSLRALQQQIPLGELGQRILIGAVVVLAWLLSWQRTFGHILPYRILPAQRHIRAAQLEVLDWLAHIAQQEPVLAIDPYHPILAPNATFLRGSWQYLKLLSHPWFQEKLTHFADQFVEASPPLITANPWPENTKNKDMIRWLLDHQVLTEPQAKNLRDWITQNYLEVRFPDLRTARFPSGTFVFGDRFWVRQDRLAACPPPEIPHQIQRPSLQNAPSSKDIESTKRNHFTH